MSIENFINFGVAISFFIGIFFSFLKFNFIIDILLGSFIIGCFSFVIITLGSTLVAEYLDFETKEYIEKDVYETVLEEYKVKINKKYSSFETLSESIHDMNIEDLVSENTQTKKDT